MPWQPTRTFGTLGNSPATSIITKNGGGQAKTEKAIELARKEGENLRFRVLFNRAQKQANEYKKRMDVIRASKVLTAREKRVQIDRLTTIRNRILEITVERFET